MAKRNKPPDVAPTPGLTHNPFARLVSGDRAADEAPAAPLAPSAPASSPTPAAGVPKRTRGRLVLRRETKHRGGKAVVIVTGFGDLAQFDAEATRELAQQLKRQLGCGGTVEERGGEREIVLQGDRPAQVAALLRARGFRVDGVTS